MSANGLWTEAAGQTGGGRGVNSLNHVLCSRKVAGVGDVFQWRQRAARDFSRCVYDP